MQITVATTGSPFVPTGWSGGTVHIGIEFYIGWNYIPPRMNLMVPLSPGPTPCVLAQQICNAINDHSVLHAEGYRARRVDNTVFVTGPYVKDCPGTVDKPALDGDANRVQTRTAVHKL
ncbi:MAG: hypothetical protein EPO68_09765 [Planctomycetota bacterium]|nr:MAG: hypothetical protein EPO68_09765 [Planctomycetota bacterium]